MSLLPICRPTSHAGPPVHKSMGGHGRIALVDNTQQGAKAAELDPQGSGAVADAVPPNCRGVLTAEFQLDQLEFVGAHFLQGVLHLFAASRRCSTLAQVCCHHDCAQHRPWKLQRLCMLQVRSWRALMWRCCRTHCCSSCRLGGTHGRRLPSSLAPLPSPQLQPSRLHVLRHW